MKPLLLVALCLTFAMSSGYAQTAPPGWRWLTDRGADATGATEFSRMPPGWHITTTAASILYDTTARAAGRYVIESSQVLFPGRSEAGYGAFIGGRSLGSQAAQFVAVLLRRDGSFAVERRIGGDDVQLVPWTRHSAIRQATDSTATVTNVIRAAVERDSVRLSVNGERVGGFASGEIPLDGWFGFRVGRDLNLHVTTLDHTVRLAPVPAPRP